MFRTHNARLIFLILLPVITGLALFPFAYLYPFSWQPDVNPTWGWIICAVGALVILIPVTGLALLCGGLQSSTTNPVSEILIDIWVDGFVRAIFFLSGALLFVMGWALGVVLVLLSHLVGVML